MDRPRETRILLLRHAETAAPDRFHGAESDVDLGPRGREQARAMARHLAEFRPAAVYSSGMRRARQTAAPIAEAAGVAPRAVEALHERKIGPLSGQLREDGWAAYAAAKDRWAAGDLDATHEGGESFAQIRARVLPPFLDLAEAHRGQTIVVVAHGIVIRVLMASLLDGSGPADFGRFGIDFVGVNDLRHDGATWRAEALNGRPADLP